MTDRRPVSDAATRLAVLEERNDATATWQRDHSAECARRYKSLHERIDRIGYAIGAALVTGVATLGTLLVQVMASHPK